MPYPNYGGAYSVNPYSGQQYMGSPMTDQMSGPRNAFIGSQIPRVPGEYGAQNYLMAPNTEAILLDSTQPRFFYKTTDATGKTASLEPYWYYKEPYTKTNNDGQGADPSRFVSREEFDELKKRLDDLTPAKKVKDNG